MAQPNPRIARSVARLPTRLPCRPVGFLAMVLLGACANPASTLVIVQNQIPSVDNTSGNCVIPVDATVSRLSGVFDVNLDRPYPYYVYPLVQSRLPSVMTAGNIERNVISLRAVRVTIRSPVEPEWEPGCPGTFDVPVAGILDPQQIRSLFAQGFQSCHAQRMRQLIAAGVIPSNQAQPVYFTLELTIVGDHNGNVVLSDAFPFPVQVCAGCLQAFFPETPMCANAPSVNMLPGNPCNIAQDGPAVLCCTDPGGALVCPAPSTPSGP